MSLMQNHIQRMGKNWLTGDMSVPYFVGGFTSVGVDVTVTPAFTPNVGDILCMQNASTSLLDPDGVVLPSGWFKMTSSISRTALFLKIATASEPASYTFGNTQSQGWMYFILRGVYTPPPILTLSAMVHVSVPGTYTTAPFDVPFYGIGISILGKNSTTLWNPSASWTVMSASGQAKAAYKIYTGIALAETLNWALSPVNTTTTLLSTLTLLFVCKSIKH